MLNGTDLGAAIKTAIEKKIASGAVASQAAIARHFNVKPPSIHDWIKKGSISKDKLPELWRYFSDVAGPEHWGLKAWPDMGTVRAERKGLSTQPWPFPSTPEADVHALPAADIQLLDAILAGAMKAILSRATPSKSIAQQVLIASGLSETPKKKIRETKK